MEGATNSSPCCSIIIIQQNFGPGLAPALGYTSSPRLLCLALVCVVTFLVRYMIPLPSSKTAASMIEFFGNMKKKKKIKLWQL